MVLLFQNCGEFESADGFANISSTDIPDSALIGKAIYAERCASCHQPIESSRKLGRSPEQIIWGIENVPQMAGIKLTTFEIRAVSEALKIDPAICEVQDKPGHIPSNRMSHQEYNRAVNDLFQITGNWTSGFTADNSASFFDNESFSKQTNSLLTEAYFNNSKRIVDSLFANQTALNRLMVCNPNQGRACASIIVNQVGRLAFRRPLDSEDINGLLGPFERAQALGLNFNDSLKASLRAILINPNFLFKIFKQTNQKVRDLDQFELATRLSFFIWGSIPDDGLLKRAEQNQLLAPEVLDQEIKRLLASPKSKYLVNSFAWQWLGLEKIYNAAKQPDPTLFPTYTSQLREDMVSETLTFFDRLIVENKSPLDLLLGDYSYLNQRLSDHYQFNQALGSDFRKVDIPSNRSGILTHGSILRMTSNPNETSIVNRGAWTMERIICEEPPHDAPDGVDTTIPELPGLSLRERLEVHRNKPACISCHSVMDPLGFAYENFGPIGQFRTQWKDGFAVDATGQLPDGSRFNGVHELALRITENGVFQRCFSKHLLSFATTRQIGLNDGCTVNRIGKRNITSESQFSDLINAVIKSDPFLRYQNEEIQ